MKQSITLTLGIFWEKRLSAAQRRFTRACETLAPPLVAMLNCNAGVLRESLRTRAKMPFVVRQRKIALIEGELTSPGSEVAYILKTQQAFIDSEN